MAPKRRKPDVLALVFIDIASPASFPSCMTGNPNRGVQSNKVPRWVKVFALVFASLLTVFALLHLTDRGFRHGPAATEGTESSH
jgi:hypothetical protein